MKKFLQVLSIGVIALAVSCTADSSDQDAIEQTKLVVTLPSSATVVDFEEFNTGDIVSTVNTTACEGSIGVMGIDPRFPGQNVAMVFDSSNPTGDDFDLGTPNSGCCGGPGISADGPQPTNDVPLGKVLILSEDLDSADPDDSYFAGTSYNFDFSGYPGGAVKLYGFDMLDLESPGANGLLTVVKLYNPGNTLIFQKPVAYGEDNWKQFVDLEGTSNVARMVLEMNNSGAIDNLAFECEEFEIGGCETAYGKANAGASCFTDYGFGNWGWTNGPLAVGTYEFELWAAAGQCDTGKGALAGKVIVDYNGSSAQVTYMTNGDYVMTETHLWVGDSPFPLKQQGKKLVPTAAPGQFPAGDGDLDNSNMETYTIDGLSGEIWVIAHAVVCEVL